MRICSFVRRFQIICYDIHSKLQFPKFCILASSPLKNWLLALYTPTPPKTVIISYFVLTTQGSKFKYANYGTAQAQWPDFGCFLELLWMHGLPRLATSYSAGKNVEKSLSNNFRLFSQHDNFVKVSFKKKSSISCKKIQNFLYTFFRCIGFCYDIRV